MKHFHIATALMAVSRALPRPCDAERRHDSQRRPRRRWMSARAATHRPVGPRHVPRLPLPAIRTAGRGGGRPPGCSSSLWPAHGPRRRRRRLGAARGGGRRGSPRSAAGPRPAGGSKRPGPETGKEMAAVTGWHGGKGEGTEGCPGTLKAVKGWPGPAATAPRALE
jgi:hypothetical protein